MIGAYLAAWMSALTGSFWLGVAGALPLAALIGMAAGTALLRRLYQRDHLVHVLATFALILIFNDRVRIVWGPLPLLSAAGARRPGRASACPIQLSAGCHRRRPRRRAAALLPGHAHADRHAGARRRVQPRDGDRHGRRHPAPVHAGLRFRAALSALAGALLGPFLAVEVGMGEDILILAFVVVVIGGIGSVRGAPSAR